MKHFATTSLMWYLDVESELLSVTSIKIKTQYWEFLCRSMKILSKGIDRGFILKPLSFLSLFSTVLAVRSRAHESIMFVFIYSNSL